MVHSGLVSSQSRQMSIMTTEAHTPKGKLGSLINPACMLLALWIKVPIEKRGNMNSTQKGFRQELNPGLSCCQATELTAAVPLLHSEYFEFVNKCFNVLKT